MGMKITINHPASKFGMPVILDEAGRPMEYPAGIRAVREKLKLTARELAEKCGVDERTVNGWEGGRTPGAAPLNMIGKLLEEQRPAPTHDGTR